MKIANTPSFAVPARSLPAFQAAPQLDLGPQDQVQIQSKDGGPGGPGGGHFSGGNVVSRVVGGAINGLLCNWLSGGQVGSAALIGGGVGLVIGGATGALGGAVVGGAAGNPGAGAVTGAALGGVIGGASGALKGAVTQALTNAVGGGPLAAAGVGAALGLLF